MPTLLLECFTLVTLLIVWAGVGVDAAKHVLIAVSGVAMGAQSAAVRASDVRGVNTTYMTGTLLGAVARLVQRTGRSARHHAGPSLPGAAWATYAVGAFAGACAIRAWHAVAMAVPLAIVGAVTGLARWDNDREER